MLLKNKLFLLLVASMVVIALAVFFFILNRPLDSGPISDSNSNPNSGTAPGEMATNPIIWADVPDPDVVRVGDEYFMVSTSMHMMPGSPIMKSSDLVNWEIVGYPYDRLEENDTYKLRDGLNAYGKGSWANSLKYHKGKFYVLFASLDTRKTYLFRTEDPSGAWERTEFAGYMHDPALLFDDNDKAYIIYGSKDFRIKELTSDYKAINPRGLNKVILSSGKEGMEGTHAYKINGRYYLTFIWWEKGEIRRQFVYRADRIDGPYEGKLALSDTLGYKQSGVAQGGLVDTPDGKWYAMLFQDHDAVGRIPVLVPVRWEDGWPVYGDEKGKVPLQFEKPGKSTFATALTKSDEFYQDDVSIKAYPMTDTEMTETRPNGSILGLQWQWNHNPNNTKWSLTERKGYLRLTTDNIVSDIQQARNTLTQRGQGPRSSGWISMDTGSMLDGDYAGLAAFQQEYGFIGVTREGDKRYIVMVEKGVEKSRTVLYQEQIYLKIDFDFVTDKAKFFYSLNGSEWTVFGSELRMRYTLPHFMGYRFALFNYATQRTGGYVDYDFFRFSNDATGSTTSSVLAAYLKEDVIEVSKEAESTYDVRLLMDEFPKDAEVRQIHAKIRIPEVFDVVDVVPNSDNLTASNVAFQSSDNELALQIENADGSAISYANRDASKELATIKIKLKREMTAKMNDEVKVNHLEIIHSNSQTESYDVSGASSKVNFTPPASVIGKIPPNGNPLVSHKFGADPYALVFKDRVYLYTTNDVLEYDAEGNIKDNSFGTINKISVISSDDLMNWTDHGVINVAGPQGAAKWAAQSWAPAAAHKVIDGKDKFFLYFANNASGIGVLTSDSPTGPWTDPIGKPLISRATPGAADVTWLFDPAVLMDDNGKGYIYFGGGIPKGKPEMPNTARVMQLGDDMISVIGEAAPIPAPYMFEDSGINKQGEQYYYSYCSNFDGAARPAGSPPPGEIAYMVSDHPMGPWTYKDTILKNPGYFFGVGGNNHHAIFQFHDVWYIAYHTQTLSKAMGVPKGYRSMHLNQVFFNKDGTIQEITADMKGVEQIKALNPFVRVEAETMAWSTGISAKPLIENEKGQMGPVNLVITDIHNGDWTAVSQVDFGTGASTFTASVSSAESGGSIELRLDHPDGKLIGTLAVPSTHGWNSWAEVKTEVTGAEGVHDLYFVFKGKHNQDLFQLDYWQFGK